MTKKLSMPIQRAYAKLKPGEELVIKEFSGFGQHGGELRSLRCFTPDPWKLFYKTNKWTNVKQHPVVELRNSWLFAYPKESINRYNLNILKQDNAQIYYCAAKVVRECDIVNVPNTTLLGYNKNFIDLLHDFWEWYNNKNSYEIDDPTCDWHYDLSGDILFCQQIKPLELIYNR